MPVRFRRRSFGRPRTRRKRVWTRFSHQFTSANLGAFDLLSGYRTSRGILQNDPGTTEGAIRFAYQFQALGAGNFTESSGVFVGIYVDDLSRPVAQISSPVVSGNVDWLFWKFFNFTEGGNGLAPADTDKIFGMSEHIKSMRKLDETEETLWFSWDTAGTTGPQIPSSCLIAGSVLLLMP